MSDLILREFAERAQGLVRVPDLAQIERRGRDQRRSRVAGVGSLAAALLAVGGWLGAGALDQDRTDPAEDPRSEPPLYLEGDGATLEPGTYRLWVSADGTRQAAVVTTPPGWRRWLTPIRTAGNSGAAMVLVSRIHAVVEDACESVYTGKTDIPPNDSQALVTALAAMPRFRVVQPPAPDDRFGHPATHLRVASDRTTCRAGTFQLWTTDLGFLPAEESSLRLDLWVVDLGEHVVLVAGGWIPGTPGWAVAEMREVIDSVEFIDDRG